MKHYRTSFKTLVLVLALLLVLLPQRAEAASAALSGNSAIQAGSTVTLKLSISGSNIMGVEATLDYDSSVLEFTNYDQQISGWTMDNSGLKFILYGVSNPINSSTNVLSVTFRVKNGLESGAALSASFKDIVVTDGNNEANIGSTSWSGKVDAPLSSNCDLSSLSCSNATLSPAFSSGTTYYSAKVPYAVESLNLNYKTADAAARATVSGNSLVVGVNTVTVTCTAATGAKKTYTISVTREQDPNYRPSTDAMLKELTLDVGSLSPKFSGAVTEYVAYVPYETASATLSGVARDEKALKVTESTMRLTNEGDNVMTVTCTAEDGTTAKTYTVHVYRMPKYEGIIPTMEIIDPNTPPEPPTYSIPMTLTLPLVGEMATTTVVIIGAALLVIILLLIGFLLGRIGSGGGYDDDDDDGNDDNGGDDTPPQPPRPGRSTPQAKHTDAPQQRQPTKIASQQHAAPAGRTSAAPVPPAQKPAVPVAQPGKVSDDTLTSPFVEDLSAKMQQELAKRQTAEAAASDADKPEPEVPLDSMSLDELLNDIHNM